MIEPGVRLEAEVGHVDRFGNLALIATAASARPRPGSSSAGG